MPLSASLVGLSCTAVTRGSRFAGASVRFGGRCGSQSCLFQHVRTSEQEYWSTDADSFEVEARASVPVLVDLREARSIRTSVTGLSRLMPVLSPEAKQILKNTKGNPMKTLIEILICIALVGVELLGVTLIVAPRAIQRALGAVLRRIAAHLRIVVATAREAIRQLVRGPRLRPPRFA